MKTEPVALRSLSENLTGVLMLPDAGGPAPVIILCHGAGEYKENYFEFGEFLTTKGFAALAMDMHGHGQSEGVRYHVEMREWVADVRAFLDWLSKHPGINPKKIGALGLSSGGTAILEAALVDDRLKLLVPLDATVHNSLPLPVTAIMKFLLLIGHIKKALTGNDLRIPLAKMGGLKVASDPEINHRLATDSKANAAYMAFPLPGAAEAFFVDTIKRVPGIKCPTMVIWGEDDTLDPPTSAKLLHAALTCEKELHIVPGNGHVGHIDRNKQKVFQLTADWAARHFG